MSNSIYVTQWNDQLLQQLATDANSAASWFKDLKIKEKQTSPLRFEVRTRATDLEDALTQYHIVAQVVIRHPFHLLLSTSQLSLGQLQSPIKALEQIQRFNYAGLRTQLDDFVTHVSPVLCVPNSVERTQANLAQNTLGDYVTFLRESCIEHNNALYFRISALPGESTNVVK